jgi:outer membrane protein OmpA-like peptidoglycan-associated protein
MKCRLVLVVIAMLLSPSIQIFAQQSASPTTFPEASSDIVNYWVAFWAKPTPVIFGPPQEAFDSSVKEVSFPFDIFDQPLDPSVLDANAQWLKDHPTNRFFIEGYASAEGDGGHNLTLSKRRAEWVKQALVSRGVAENQILLATGWGHTYPVCAELDEQCLSKNRLVRFIYSPRQ